MLSYSAESKDGRKPGVGILPIGVEGEDVYEKILVHVYDLVKPNFASWTKIAMNLLFPDASVTGTDSGDWNANLDNPPIRLDETLSKELPHCILFFEATKRFLERVRQFIWNDSHRLRVLT